MPDQFAILNDVTLKVFGKQVQFDSLIITSQANYIIEVKSFEGTVTFDTMLKQFIQENGENLEGYKYPITQVESSQFHLLRWLQKRNLNGLPIYYFIVFAEQSTIINVKGDEDAVRKVVSYVDEIPLRLIRFDEQLKKNRPANNQLKNKIISTIMRECEDFDYDVLGRFGIKKSEILPGVHCPECDTLGMERRNNNWYCHKCNKFSRDAHRKALYDYTLLIHNKMKNEDCRKFLQLKSRFVARKMLQNSHLELIKGTRIWMSKK